MCACICECVHAHVHRHMCVVYLHTHVCGAAVNVCVHEHVCTRTCLACKCVLAQEDRTRKALVPITTALETSPACVDPRLEKRSCCRVEPIL